MGLGWVFALCAVLVGCGLREYDTSVVLARLHWSAGV
jgi:hypothetical protein